MQEELLRRGLGSSFDMPSVYITGPKGIEAVSTNRIIQRGDFVTIDWGVCLMNFCTDVKRQSYVLRVGETAPPASIQHAWDQAARARELIRQGLRGGPGKTAAETLKVAEARVAAEKGFAVMKTFNEPYAADTTDVMIGMHSVGNTGHGAGPSMAFFNPLRLTYEIKPSNMFSIEFFAYTMIPEWGGAKLRVPFEDDAVMTARGIEYLHPPTSRLLTIR
jgi:Xaa-Pro aminopeptidase